MVELFWNILQTQTPFPAVHTYVKANPVYTIFHLCIYQSGGESFNSPCQFWLLHICLVICWKRNKKMINHRQRLLTSLLWLFYLSFIAVSFTTHVTGLSYKKKKKVVFLKKLRTDLTWGMFITFQVRDFHLPVSYFQTQTLNNTVLLFGLFYLLRIHLTQVPVNIARHVCEVQMKEWPPVWRVAANILNQQLWRADKGKLIILQNISQGLGLGLIIWYDVSYGNGVQVLVYGMWKACLGQGIHDVQIRFSGPTGG